MEIDPAVTDWLLDGDPAIRWQVLRDLTDAPAAQVAGERAQVADRGWGAQLLAAQDADGRWDGGVYRPGWVNEQLPFFDAWTATHFTLQSLADLGVDPSHPRVRRCVELVRDRVCWPDGRPYFQGESEPCSNGIAARSGATLGQDVGAIVTTLLAGVLPDGGWNCDPGSRVSSFHSTLCAVEGLWAAERAGHPAAAVARPAGEEYLLQRKLFRRLSDGSVVDPRFLMLSFPVRWYYDVLRGLEHFRSVGRRDERLAEAVELIRSRRRPDGRWNLELHHEGPQLVEFGAGEGRPDRWTTLRALRVLRWWDVGDPAAP